MKKLNLKIMCIVIILGLMGCGPNQFKNRGPNMAVKTIDTTKIDMNLYNKDEFITIAATIDEIGENEQSGQGGIGLHLYITTDNGKYYKIHVAPQMYIDKNNIKFKVGEKLKITGIWFATDKDASNIYAYLIVRKNSNKATIFRNAKTKRGIWRR